MVRRPVLHRRSISPQRQTRCLAHRLCIHFTVCKVSKLACGELSHILLSRQRHARVTSAGQPTLWSLLFRTHRLVHYLCSLSFAQHFSEGFRSGEPERRMGPSLGHDWDGVGGLFALWKLSHVFNLWEGPELA